MTFINSFFLLFQLWEEFNGVVKYRIYHLYMYILW